MEKSDRAVRQRMTLQSVSGLKSSPANRIDCAISLSCTERKEVKINSMNSNTAATATPPPPTPAAAAAATATAAHTTSLKCSSRSAFACGVSTNTNTSTNSRNNMTTTTTATATVASLTTAKRYYCFQLHSSHRQLLRKKLVHGP